MPMARSSSLYEPPWATTRAPSETACSRLSLTSSTRLRPTICRATISDSAMASRSVWVKRVLGYTRMSTLSNCGNSALRSATTCRACLVRESPISTLSCRFSWANRPDADNSARTATSTLLRNINDPAILQLERHAQSCTGTTQCSIGDTLNLDLVTCLGDDFYLAISTAFGDGDIRRVIQHRHHVEGHEQRDHHAHNENNAGIEKIRDSSQRVHVIDRGMTFLLHEFQ